MKKQTTFLAILCASLFILSCDDESVTEEFDNANGDIQVKLIESISVITAQDFEENKDFLFSYTSDGYLNSVTDGIETSTLDFDTDNNLSIVTARNESLNIEKLYESPYDAFETGNVVEYDNNGNPTKIEFFEEDYDRDSQSYISYIYTAEISYDNTHNPFFYTLEAAGIIDVLDGVKLNFSVNPQVPEIVQARALFPVNNPSLIVYKNEEGAVVYTTKAEYTYDSENYPKSAAISGIFKRNREEKRHTITFKYL